MSQFINDESMDRALESNLSSLERIAKTYERRGFLKESAEIVAMIATIRGTNHDEQQSASASG